MIATRAKFAVAFANVQSSQTALPPRRKFRNSASVQQTKSLSNHKRVANGAGIAATLGAAAAMVSAA